MLYSYDVINELRSSCNIVSIVSSYVSLKQKGTSYFGLCPFHNEKTPSFSVNADRQTYYCFGCNAAGNVLTFIMQIENMNFVDAVKLLAGKVGYVLPESNDFSKRDKLIEINKTAARFFFDNLKDKSYINSRNVSDKTRLKFGLGYAPGNNALYNHLIKTYSQNDIADTGLIIKSKYGKYYDRFANRLMFPILNVHSKVIGFGGRSLDDSEPKYLNSPETILFNKSSNLYNMNLAYRHKHLYLVEGYMDVISLYQNGIENVVGVLGTAFNNKHAVLLKRYCNKVTLLFDADEAGIRAMLRAIPILQANNISANVLQLPDAKDPDEYIKTHGRDDFIKLPAIDCISFQIANAKSKYDISIPNDKIQFVNEVTELISKVTEPVTREVYIDEINKLTNVSHQTIKDALDKNNIHITKKDNSFNKLGIDKAKEEMLSILAKCNQKVITPEEFRNELYERVCQMIYTLHDENIEIDIANLISYFETAEQQNIVSRIFENETDYEDVDKAIDDIVRRIRLHNISCDIANESDVNKLKMLIEEKKRISK